MEITISAESTGRLLVLTKSRAIQAVGLMRNLPVDPLNHVFHENFLRNCGGLFCFVLSRWYHRP